jgi:hypothetical protein
MMIIDPYVRIPTQIHTIWENIAIGFVDQNEWVCKITQLGRVPPLCLDVNEPTRALSKSFFTPVIVIV